MPTSADRAAVVSHRLQAAAADEVGGLDLKAGQPVSVQPAEDQRNRDELRALLAVQAPAAALHQAAFRDRLHLTMAPIPNPTRP